MCIPIWLFALHLKILYLIFINLKISNLKEIEIVNNPMKILNESYILFYIMAKVRMWRVLVVAVKLESISVWILIFKSTETFNF